MPKRFLWLALLAGCQPAPPPSPAVVSFKQDVVPVLRARCTTCHVTGGIGPFAMVEKDATPRYQVVHDRIKSMVEAIETGYMPLNAKGSVSAEELATLRAWRDAQAPDN